MENSSHIGRTEPYSNVDNAESPQFQPFYTAVPTSEAVYDVFSATEDPQVSIETISTSLSSFPRRQVYSNINEESPQNYHPWQPSFGNPSDSQVGVSGKNSNAFTIPVTIVPRRTTNGQVKFYSEDVWETHKSKIRQLYLEYGKKLVDVMQQMNEEEHFKPSLRMYKTHLDTWGFFKNNREKDVASLLRLKKARDMAGKSSVIFRSGKPVDIKRINDYIRRKKVDTRTLIHVEEDYEMARVPNHIYIRTPSPVSKSTNLLIPSSNLRDKEIVLYNINQCYRVWVSDSSKLWTSKESHEPHIFFSGRMGRLNVLDSMSLLLQHGLNIFKVNQFSEGGACIREAFILVEVLFDITRIRMPDKQQLAWIFGFWKLLSECFHHDISRMLLIHMTKMAQKYLPMMHPLREILCCLCRVYSGSERELSRQFISSIWTDAILAIKGHLNSSGMIAAVCLPYNFWMGETTGHLRQYQETVMEFQRAETMNSWQQRTKNLAFRLCNQKQLFGPSLSHTGVLTLMWLRHFVVDSVKDTMGFPPSRQNNIYNSYVEKFLFKTAILTRLELSIGRGCNQASYENIRVLSGDVYQIGHLHHLQLGEDIDAFRKRHNLDVNNFEKAKNVFQATNGVETEKTTWFKWLQTLEESLIGSWDQPLVQERQTAESIMLHHSLRGTGFMSDY